MVYVKTYLLDHFYEQYLVLLTMVPCNRLNLIDLGDREMRAHTSPPQAWSSMQRYHKSMYQTLSYDKNPKSE